MREGIKSPFRGVETFGSQGESLFTTASVIAVGDSFVIGGAGGIESFMVPLAVAWGDPTVDNNGVNGTVLQNSNGSGGTPLAGNLMDNFTARTITPTAETLVCAYGLNDGRYTAVSGANGAGQTFTAARYKEDLQSCVRRWLPIFGIGNIFLATPHFISDTGLATAGGVDFQGQTRLGYEEFVDACRDVAEEFGVWLVDTYAAGEPANTIDDLHPTVASKDAIAALFGSATRAKLAGSVLGITGDAAKIVVASGYEAYIVDGATETALSVGDNAASVGFHTVVYRQSSSNSWEQVTVEVVAGSSWVLDGPVSNNVGFTVNSDGPDNIDLTGTTSRNSITWDGTGLAIGTRVQMDLNSANFKRVIVRSNVNNILGGTPNETIYDDSFVGAASVDFTTTATNNFVGFLTLASGGLTVTNLVITPP